MEKYIIQGAQVIWVFDEQVQFDCCRVFNIMSHPLEHFGGMCEIHIHSLSFLQWQCTMNWLIGQDCNMSRRPLRLYSDTHNYQYDSVADALLSCRKRHALLEIMGIGNVEYAKGIILEWISNLCKCVTLHIICVTDCSKCLPYNLHHNTGFGSFIKFIISIWSNSIQKETSVYIANKISHCTERVENRIKCAEVVNKYAITFASWHIIGPLGYNTS